MLTPYATSVKFICSNAAGYDKVDVDAAAKRGIYISNTPGAVDSVRIWSDEVVIKYVIDAVRRQQLISPSS